MPATDPAVQAVARALHADQCPDDECDGGDMGEWERQAGIAVDAARPLVIEDFLTHHHRPSVTIDNAEQVKGFMAEAIREAKAEAWDEGFRTSDQCWTETGDITTPDEERTSPFNPYRAERLRKGEGDE